MGNRKKTPIKMDPLSGLPQTKEAATRNDLEIIKTLFGEGEKLTKSIRGKEVIIATILFILLSLSWTDSLIKQKVVDNPVLGLVVKAAIFCAILIFLQLALK